MIIPAVLLVTGLVMIGYVSPIYSGLQSLDYDCAYQYLFNGAGLMKGYNPSHTDHPGTPVQILTGLISILSWSIAKLCGWTSLAFPESIATNPEEYLRVIMTAFLLMNCAAVGWLGAAIARSTGYSVAGIACQTGYFLFGALFPRIFYAAPEAILCLSAMALMSVLAPVLFDNRDCSDRRAAAAGFFVALGLASKATFLPLLLLTLLLQRPRAVFIALCASALYMFLFLLPIVGHLKRVFSWLFGIATHNGRHGDGAAGFMDWTVIPERAWLIASGEPLLVVAAVAVAAVIVFSSSGDRLRAAIVAAALGTMIVLVLKHYSIHYLMPGVAIAPAVFIWAVSRFARRRLPYVAAAIVASVIAVVSIHNMSSAFANERALRLENEQAINAVIARYQNPVVIGAYRSGYKPLAVVFGLAWSDLKFARLFPQTTAADSLTYDGGLKKLWRAHSGPVEWHHLDQFEKAGRVVLIIQSRDSKIEPQTARTETVLDQGFGDTVDRIVVAPSR